MADRAAHSHPEEADQGGSSATPELEVTVTDLAAAQGPGNSTREELVAPRNEDDPQDTGGDASPSPRTIAPQPGIAVPEPSGPRVRPSNFHLPIDHAPVQERTFLSRRAEGARERFQTIAHELSFGQYLEAVKQKPSSFLRNSAGLHVDALEYWDQGEIEMITRLGRTFRRFRAVELPWEPETIQKKRHLQGQDWALYNAYLVLKVLANQAFPDYGILFHGPPGSGKTILSEDVLMGAVQAYTQRAPEGAIYGTCFELPPKLVIKAEQGGIGFGPSQLTRNENGNLLIVTKSNPIFLLSDIPDADGISDRVAFLYDELGYKSPPEGVTCSTTHDKNQNERGTYGPDDRPVDFNVDYLLRGTPDPTAQALYRLLENHFEGDLEEVFSLIKAVRWTMNSALSQGLVNVSPISSPDANVAAVAAHGNRVLPEMAPGGGEIVPIVTGIGPSAHRGRLNMQEGFKGQTATSLSYLLGPLEGRPYQIKSQGHLVHFIPDQVITLEENDPVAARVLDPGAEGSDAIQSRIRKVAVPLARIVTDEERIYRQEVGNAPLAPYALKVAAIWAVGTRTLQPNAESHAENEELSNNDVDLIADLGIVEKLLLLDDVPDRELNLLRNKQQRFTTEEIASLRRLAPLIADEYDNGDIPFAGYDGAQGFDTRKAVREILRPLIDQADGEPLSVLNVVNFLETSGVTRDYDRLIREAQDRLVALYFEKENANEDFRLTNESKRQEAKKEIAERYRFVDGEDLNSCVRQIAKELVKRDFEEALGMASVEQAIDHVRKYLYHCRAYANAGMHGIDLSIPEPYRDGISEKPSETIMRAFEDQYSQLKKAGHVDDNMRDAFRKGITKQLGNWSLKHGTSALDRVDQVFSTLVDRVFEDLAGKHRHYITDYAECLETGVGRNDPSEKAVRFRDANAELLQRGYPKNQLRPHFGFAFDMKAGQR